MILLILQSLYLMIPAYVANMTPVIIRIFVHHLDTPIDFGTRLFGKRLFGNHKTWRGLIYGILFGVIICYFQFTVRNILPFKLWSIVDYSHWLIIGFLLSAGALAGDMLKSTIKRQFNIKEGKPFVPFDQLDFVFGSLIFFMFYQRLIWQVVLIIIVLSFFLHIITNHIAFYLKIRNEKW